MYKKKIKINGKKYDYYYHNFKINGKVKNICLGRNKEEASMRLEELFNKDIKTNLMYREHQKINLRNNSKTFLVVLIAILSIGALYYFEPSFTGLAVYENDLSSLSSLAEKFSLVEILGIIISLELIFFGYNIYRDYKNKVKLI